MPLLSSQDEETVRRQLDAIQHQVTIVFFTQAIGAPDSALMARQIVDEMAALSDRITVEEANLVLDREKAAQYGIDQIPAIVLLRDGEDTRMRFLGAPSGYEFASLLEALILAGGDDSGLTAESRHLIADSVTQPTEILVFVTPSCPHCPRAVTLAHRMAVESPNIKATCIEATEFMDLSRQYRVTGVPKTVVNGQFEILGALPEREFVIQALGASTVDTPAPPAS